MAHSPDLKEKILKILHENSEGLKISILADKVDFFRRLIMISNSIYFGFVEQFLSDYS